MQDKHFPKKRHKHVMNTMHSNSDELDNSVVGDKSSEHMKTRQQEPESESQVSSQHVCVEMKAECQELNYMLANTEKVPEWRIRRKNLKRAVNICGYVALATAGLPLITGKFEKRSIKVT